MNCRGNKYPLGVFVVQGENFSLQSLRKNTEIIAAAASFFVFYCEFEYWLLGLLSRRSCGGVVLVWVGRFSWKC